MSIADMAWAWTQSRHVAGGRGPRALRRRLAFVRQAASLHELLAPLRTPAPGSALQRALHQRPQLVGAVSWPYVCAQWGAPQRLRHLVAHFQAMGRLPALALPADGALQLLDLAELSPGLRVVLDEPAWFMREGPLVLNLFAGDERLYSLAFSFGTGSGAGAAPVAYVGALQGVATEDALARYRELTKALHGLRPRDFLVELLRMLCRSVGAARILAVADAGRVHRSAYFGPAKSSQLQVDYDTLWRERGGVPQDTQFFELPLVAPARELGDVPSKKRAMYRRRQDMLAALDPRLAAACLPRGPAARKGEPAPPAPGFAAHEAQHA